MEITKQFKPDELFDLYATSSLEINKDINKTLHNYQTSYAFFEYYTKTNIIKLFSVLSEFNSNLLEIFDESKTSNDNFKLNIDKYISTLSKIYLALNLIHKNHEILTNFFLLIKNSYYKLCFDNNNFSINNIKPISDYINELTNIYSKNNNNISTPEFSSNQDRKKEVIIHIENNSLNEENANFDNVFVNKIKSYKTSNNLRSELSKKNSLFRIHNENNPKNYIDNLLSVSGEKEIIIERQNSNLSLSKMKFAEDEQNIDKKNNKNKDIRKNKSCNKARFKNILSKSRISIIENKHDIEMYRKLLEISFGLYRSCIINSEEKVKLKHLIISKSNKIERIYKDYFILYKYDKNTFISKLKEIIKE